tara:strand:+ start:386 stop:502 length:117 start_codon:yes stop_codon:yes gene_type:complete
MSASDEEKTLYTDYLSEIALSPCSMDGDSMIDGESFST